MYKGGLVSSRAVLQAFAACVLVVVWTLPTAAAERAAPVVELPVAPEAVTLYPDGARLSVSLNVPVVGGAVQLTLPAGVRRDSVSLSLDGRTVRSLTLSSVPVADSPSMRKLREAYEAARDAVFANEGALASLKARRELWTKPEMRMTQAAEVERLDRLMSERLSALYVEEGRLDAQLERNRNARDRARQMLDEAGGLAVAGVLLRAEVTPPAAGTTHATLAYALENCGWRSLYRIEADPANNLVRVVQEAEVRQASGVDWKGVRLTLATADPGSGLEPAPVQPWNVRPRVQPQPRPQQTRAKAAPQAANADTMLLSMSAMESSVAPTRELETFSTWDLGERDVPAGTPQRLALEQNAWPAEFSRIARPARDPRVYLSAHVTLPAARSMPSGMATWIVAGETVGSGLFSLTGSSADLFFGVDPRVTTEMKLDTRQSGRQGFVDRRQTRVWSWTIEVKNAHATPVTVRIEDAEPRSGDQAITIEASSEPAVAESKDQSYAWKLDLPAGGTQTITHRVTVSAPDDMQLEEGR